MVVLHYEKDLESSNSELQEILVETVSQVIVCSSFFNIKEVLKVSSCKNNQLRIIWKTPFTSKL
jgi:hypothetical protein